MTLFKNILILVLATIFSGFFVYGSFVFGEGTIHYQRTSGRLEVKKTLATIVNDGPKKQHIQYTPYKSGATSTGILSLDFGRLSTAFVMAGTSPNVTFSGAKTIQYENLQGIISLYDPFTLYTVRPLDQSYQLTQITNGSFYVSNEPDQTVSIYSIDAVMELTFFDKGEKMTDMILFPGMYIRFDPQASLALKGADLFKVMLVLGDTRNDKNTGLEFVNPRVPNGDEEDAFFMFKLPTVTRPLFQMLHLLFNERIDQVDLIKNYTSSRTFSTEEDMGMIYNPSKKNYYLLDELKGVLSRAVQSKMDSRDFRSRIEKIYQESQSLMNGNSVQATLETFLTDARFAVYKPDSTNSNFGAIYTETASILKKIPESGKGKFFQNLSDIYSLNIVLRRKDPTFSGIDTYSPTAEGLRLTLENTNIESKDYFDIALYAYQLLQKAQDRQLFTPESLSSEATHSLIRTLFMATDKYVKGLPSPEEQKAAYQTLIIQFYTPIASTMSRSLYSMYTTNIDDKIYLDKNYLNGDKVKFDVKIKNYLESVYATLSNSYEQVAPLYGLEDQQYAFISFKDSLTRMGGFIDMITEGNYREYQKLPFIGSDVGGVFLPNIITDGKIEVTQPVVENQVPINQIQPVVDPTMVTTPEIVDPPIVSADPQ